MSKEIDNIFQFDIMSEPSIINTINQYDNNEFISPMENINYFPSPSPSTNYCETQKRKKFPNFPIKNIYHPELFLDRECLDTFKCGICENICDDPVIPCCGCDKIFCRKCLFFYYDNNHNECPECKKVNTELSKISAIGTVIKLKKMKCINYTEGCTWQGKYMDYRDHITQKCPKEIINCPFKGCIIKLKREEMESHMRDCEFLEKMCEKCSLKIPKNEIEEHKNVCLKELIPCPQGCKMNIERGDINLHKQSCIYSYINCPFELFGCIDKYKRIERESRLKQDMEKHLNLTMDKILSLQNEIKDLNQKVLNMENDINKLKKKETDDIKELQEKTKNLTNNTNNTNNSFFDENDSTIKDNNYSLLEYENGVKNNQYFNKDREKELKNDKYKKPFQNSYLSNKRKSSHNNSNNNNNDSCELASKDNEEENNNDFFNNQQYTDMYDLSHLDKFTQNLFVIKTNIIESHSLRGKKQYYVLFNKRYDIPKASSKKYKIQFKLLKETQWLGLGVCDKKIVENNKYEFSPTKKNNGKSQNIGTYVINTSKMAWNCNNVKQCRKFACSIKADSTFELIMSPSECELEFKCDDKLVFKFNDVRCFRSDCFSPCLIFLQKSIVQSIFYYP